MKGPRAPRELNEALEASGVRGLLTAMLDIFDLEGKHELSKQQLTLSASALGCTLSAATWQMLVTRYGTVGENKDKIDLSLVSQHFSSKYDPLLEGVLRTLMSGLMHVAPTVLKLKETVAQLAETVDELQGGAARDRQRKMEVVMRRWQHGVLVPAFDGWRSVVEGQRELLQRTARHWQNGIISGAWRRWREMVEEVVSQRRAVAQVIGRMRDRIAAAAFATWKELYDESRARWAIAQRALLRWSQQQLAGGFFTWKEAVDEAKANRAAIAKALGRMLHRAAAVAFEGWRQAVETAKWQREVVSRVLGRMMNRLASSAFAAWHEAVEAAVEARRKALLRLAMRTLVLAFERWKDQFFEQKEQKDKMRQLMARMLNALLGRCFDGWVVFYEEQRRILRRAAYAMGPGRLLSIAYFTWSYHVRELVAEREASTFDARLAEGIEQYLKDKIGVLNTIREQLADLPAELEVRVSEAAKLETAKMEMSRREWEQLRAEEERQRHEAQQHRQKTKQEQLLVRVMRRWQRKTVVVAFDGWVALVQAAREALQRSGAMWRNIILARAWRSWQSVREQLRATYRAEIEAAKKKAREQLLLTGLRSVGVQWVGEMLTQIEQRRMPQLATEESGAEEESTTLFDLLDIRYVPRQPSGAREAAQLDRDLKTLENVVSAVNEQSIVRYESLLKIVQSAVTDPNARAANEKPQGHRPLNAPPHLSFGAERATMEHMDKLMDKLGMGTQPALLARRRSVGPTSSTSVPTLPAVKSGAGGAVRGAGAAGHHHKLALSDAE